MERKRSKARFWTVVTLANLFAMMYPMDMYINANTNDARLFAAIVMAGVAFVMAITDAVSVVVAYGQCRSALNRRLFPGYKALVVRSSKSNRPVFNWTRR